jgi:hypothetical protein
MGTGSGSVSPILAVQYLNRSLVKNLCSTPGPQYAYCFIILKLGSDASACCHSNHSVSGNALESIPEFFKWRKLIYAYCGMVSFGIGIFIYLTSKFMGVWRQAHHNSGSFIIISPPTRTVLLVNPPDAVTGSQSHFSPALVWIK